MTVWNGRLASFCALLILMGAGAPETAQAAVYEWDGGGTTNNWSDGDNWTATPGGAPVSALDTTVVFPDSPRTTAVQDITAAGVAFELNRLEILGTSPAYSISGSPLRFVADGSTEPVLFSNRHRTSTIANDVEVLAGTTLSFQIGTYAVTMDGIISGDGALVKTALTGGLNLTNGDNSFSGGIRYDGLGASDSWNHFTVTQSGAMGTGLVTLNGGNTTLYDDTTNDRPGGLFFTGNTTHNNAFELVDDSPILVGRPWIAGDAAHTTTLSGSFDLNDNKLFLRGPGTGTLSGQVSGAGGITKIGSGTWELTNGGNDYTGPTVIGEGTLSVDALADGGQPSDIGASSDDASNLVVHGTLRYTGSSATTDRNIRIDSGRTATFDITQAGTTLTFSHFHGSAVTGGNLVKRGPGTLKLLYNGPGAGAGYITYLDSVEVHEGDLLSSGSDIVQLNVKRALADGPAILLEPGTTLSLRTPLDNTAPNGEQLVRYTGGGGMATIAAGMTFSGTAGETNTKTFDIADGTDPVDLLVTEDIGVYWGGYPTGKAYSQLKKTGEGVLGLSGSAKYFGDTLVEEGGLLVDGSLHADSDVFVSAPATLGGSGTIGGNVDVQGGTITPGSSVGTLAINQNLSLDADATLAFELGAPNTAGSDLITGVDDLILDGTLDVTAVAGFGSPVRDDRWTLIEYDGVLTDNGLELGNLPTLEAGRFFRLDLVSLANGGRVDLVVDVPEPAGCCLALLGMLGFCSLRRRRQRA